MKQPIKSKSVQQFRKDDLKFRIIKLKYRCRILFSFGKKKESAKTVYRMFSEPFRVHRSENSLPSQKYFFPTDIVLYDLIPKTKLSKTKRGIINLYKKCFSHKFLHGGRSETDIDNLIEGLDSALHSGDSWYSIGLFDFANSKKLNSYIDFFILRIHNYSSSYAALEMQLALSDGFKNEMNRFISSDYKKEGMAVHYHWVTNKKASGAKFGYGVSSGSPDEYAKNNIIYEQLEMVKTMFLKELSHFFQLMNFSKEKKLPGIYVCDTNITPDLDLGNAIYASLGIHERYGFFLSPEERLYVSITKDGIHTDSDDMLYIYNSSKITDYAMYSTPNNKALHYLTNDYMFEMYRVYILRVLGIRHLNILTKYRNKINNIKYSRFSLRKLLKVRNHLRKDFYDFLKINDEFPIDNATEELKAYLEKNEYARKSVFLERIHPYRYWLSAPQAIWQQVVSNLNEIENDLNRKIEIASGVTEFYREGSNRRVGYIQLGLALLTFILLLFPKLADNISQSIMVFVELLQNLFK